ncbi:MAG: SigE family RNA polymerase sigma factor [Actinomycetota bacterium]|nr:SigE family RNA polymerase sigma factor [Actinomycetota bacterium]
MTTVDGGTPQEVEILDADSALSELHRTHYRSCLRIAALLVDDPGSAEEVVQEAFVKVYRAWDKVRDMHAAPAYLRVVVVNTARSRLRRKYVAAKHPPIPDGHAPGADDSVLVNEEHRAVIAALQTLPRRQREVLTLRYYSDLSEREIADALGIGVGAVKSNASRGIAALAKKMEGHR